jgi:flagellar biosynthesis/type III secretory pathway protein FliH
MTLGLGKIIPREELEGVPPASPQRAAPRAFSPARVLPPAIVDAEERAARIVQNATDEAARRLRDAEEQLGEVRDRFRREALAEASSRLAAEFIALRAAEDRADERALERTTELARLLAERLLGEALALDPTRVVALARRALADLRGARQVTLVAHPEDRALLERALADGQLGNVTCVSSSAERARGSLRIETELGVLDADTAPQLDRLIASLREALRHER